jgi:hypothetical protein
MKNRAKQGFGNLFVTRLILLESDGAGRGCAGDLGKLDL